MASPNTTDTNKLISDRGPAQPSGLTDEGEKGSNNINDQYPASTESMAKQDELKNTRPKPASR